MPSSADISTSAEEDDTVAKPTMEPLGFPRRTIEESNPDLLREMMRTFAETLMSAEASAAPGAAYGERSTE